MTTGHSEAKPFWVEFLRSLARRGLRGAELVVSDAHEGLKDAIRQVIGASWQRCRVGLLNYSILGFLACRGQPGSRSRSGKHGPDDVFGAVVAFGAAQDPVKSR